MIQKFLLQILKYIAHFTVTVHKPFIIGITGTVGKSTITSHVGKFLSENYGHKNVRYSHEHYNGEYGLPLTIIHEKSPGRNIFLWIRVIIKGCFGIFLPFPKYLILEYGIDHPGEMDFLLKVATPDVVIVTEIAPNHLEQFGTLELYRKEKLKLVEYATHVIVHSSLKQYIDREAVFYGIGSMSDVDISHLKIDISGTHAQINTGKITHTISLPTFGTFHIENILPLYTLSKILAIDSDKITSYLKNYSPESGRSGLLPGIQGSIIIDGSYNGGYLSMREGITSLMTLLTTHRIIYLLGDMRELGKETENTHKLLASDINSIIPHSADVVFYFVGPLVKQFLIPHLATSFEIHHTLSSIDAGESIRKLLNETPTIPTVIFVKGSQNTIFLEEGIKKFLDSSLTTQGKLCRQTPDWLKKKKDFFESLG